MTLRLSDFAKERGIKYFLINFTDLFGAQRSKLVPTQAIDGMQDDGAGFAGFATHLDMTPGHPDMFSVPDPTSVIQLPWKKEVAWVAGDLMMEGKSVEQGPRGLLKRIRKQALDKGLILKAGVECEFHLINEDGTDISDPKDIQAKPCYDQQSLMRRYDVISEICDAMIELGWGPYQNDHEDANGQFEMNWDFAECLTMADQHAFFKFLARSVAEKHGLRATFMPKPFVNLTGNGCHSHFSVWDAKTGKNLFKAPDGELGLSEMAYHFLGGIIKNAAGLCAITNPTVNSYKRINAPATLSGATWSPSSITYGGNNRTHMLRIPADNRMEFRLADGAANPYLLQAGLLAAGLDGIENKTNPGKRLDIDMYAEGHKIKAPKLPSYLIDAIRAFEKNGVLKKWMGDEFHAAYTKLKLKEWDSYARHLTDWERVNTLDC
jgi:glutamine synthetase type III